MTPVHIPVIRRGKPYESLEHTNVDEHRTHAVLATVSQVNAGVIRKDLSSISDSRATLKKFSVAELIDISARAGDLFLNGTLPLGNRLRTQSPEDYIDTLSST